VAYIGTYVWSLRQFVGSQLLLVPGAQVLLVNEHGLVYLQRRTDLGLWEIPAGACEVGSSFAGTAIAELREETGLQVGMGDLVAFACLSDPAIHIIEYPNGDRTHCFAMCFAVRTWSGEISIDPEEVVESGFFALDALPSPMYAPTIVVLELYSRFQATGLFQVK
jgi:8-oxo-dGTP pyrophosphatase MutT (NUDIX family)